MAIQAAEEESDLEDEFVDDAQFMDNTKTLPCSKRIIHNVTWIGDPVIEHNSRSYYYAAQVGKILIVLR